MGHAYRKAIHSQLKAVRPSGLRQLSGHELHGMSVMLELGLKELKQAKPDALIMLQALTPPSPLPPPRSSSAIAPPPPLAIAPSRSAIASSSPPACSTLSFRRGCILSYRWLHACCRLLRLLLSQLRGFCRAGIPDFQE